MSFATLKATAGREPFTIIEVDVDSCANTYGIAPCTASGAVGTECFNSWKTCQDTPNFNKVVKTYFFTYDHPQLPRGLNYFPCLVEVSFTSARITPGEGVGARARAKIILQDFSDTDQFTDKYYATRSYTPMSQGTFFGKFTARFPYLVNRVVRIKTGYLTRPFDTSNFQTRTYVIDRINGPTPEGKVEIEAIDILSKIQKQTAPKSNNGILVAAMSISETGSFEIDTGEADFPASNGSVRIDSEIITYSTRSGNVFSTLTRGAYNTVAKSHSIKAGVQSCLVYTDVNVVDVVSDLLTTYAEIDAAYIPTADWNTEKTLWLANTQLTAVISKPEKINKLLSEITEQCLLDIWFDEIDNEIKLKAFTPPQNNTNDLVIDDDKIIARTFSAEEIAERRYTQVLFYYGAIDPTKNLDETSNFENIYWQKDTDAENENAFNEAVTKSIFSRWFPTSQEGSVLRSAGRLLGRFAKTPVRVKLKVDIKDNAFSIGDFTTLDTSRLQDADGSNLVQNMQIIEAQETMEATTLQLTLLSSGFSFRYGFIGPSTLGNFTTETAENKRKYAFICGADGKMSDGSNGYLII